MASTVSRAESTPAHGLGGPNREQTSKEKVLQLLRDIAQGRDELGD